MNLNLGETTISFLKERPGDKFTARQIADWIFATFPGECETKKQTSQSISTDAELVQQLVAEISSQRPRLENKYPDLKTTEERPRKYYYSEKSDSAEVAAAEEEGITFTGGTSDVKIKERDLYPMLAKYLWGEHRVYSKRINDKTSSNKRGPAGNRWLHPDVVGMVDLGACWHQEVRDCVAQYSDRRTKLWSFEVKLLVNRSNVRECFFQAVSNSSWANFGYLAAAEISKDAFDELQILSSGHGIGVIALNTGNPGESEVRIQAREKVEIDWDAANRLAVENKDFLEYVKLVKQFYQTGETRLADWNMP